MTITCLGTSRWPGILIVVRSGDPEACACLSHTVHPASTYFFFGKDHLLNGLYYSIGVVG